MMILRIFRVTIKPEYREDFERDFNSISIDMVKNHPGIISYEMGYPTKWNPDEYTLITKWENEEVLEEFVGTNWNESVIPDSMKKYPKKHCVDHFVIV